MPRVDPDDPRSPRPHPRPRRPLRLFVAAYPTAEVVDRLWRDVSAAELPPHRRTPPDQVHLTLLFIGDVDPRDLDEVSTSVDRAAAAVDPFELVLDRWITLPERGPARLVAAVAAEVAASRILHERLVHRLARRPKRRERFRPHLTLLRFRPPVSGFSLDRPIEPISFPVDRISLVRSTLHRSGAEHREVRDVPL